jgi:3-dehydroquinate dehydratase type I
MTLAGIVSTLISEQESLLPTVRKKGGDIAEVRLDKNPIPPSILRGFEDVPIILTVRRKQDGGYYAGDNNARLELMSSYIGSVELFDVEVDVVEKAEKILGDVPFLVSYHNLKKTPSFRYLKTMVKDYSSYGPVKIATMGRSNSDAINLLKLVSELDNVTAFCIGETFKFTRIVAFLLGAPFLYTFLGDKAAEGQLHTSEARKIVGALK